MFTIYVEILKEEFCEEFDVYIDDLMQTIEVGKFKNFKDAFEAVVEKVDEYDPWNHYGEFEHNTLKYGWTGFISTEEFVDGKKKRYYIENDELCN